MRAVKVPRLEGGTIGHRTESLVNWDSPMAMVSSFHQGNIYTKRKLRVWRDLKWIAIVGAITALNCEGRQSTLYRGMQYRAQSEKFGKLGRTYGHGTRVCTKEIFIPKGSYGNGETRNVFR